MDTNLPDVLAEVTRQCRRYEQALVHNDVALLDELFWNSPHTLRYGATENLYGYTAIAEFRATRAPQGLQRSLLKTVITTYGRDFATANIGILNSSAREAPASDAKVRLGCAPIRAGALSPPM